MLSMALGLAAAPVSSAHPAVPLETWDCTGPACVAINYHSYDSNTAWGDASEVLIKSPTCVASPNSCFSYHYGIGNFISLSEVHAGFSYYVTAGYAFPGPPGQSNGAFSYIWGDWRPQDPSANVHFKAYVSSGDIGQYVGLVISRAADCDYDVFIEAPSGTLTGESTANCLSTNQTSMGLSVNANMPPVTSATSPVVQFVDNQQDETNTTWSYYQSNGIVAHRAPADAEWVVTPQSDTTHTGGEFQTACDC